MYGIESDEFERHLDATINLGKTYQSSPKLALGQFESPKDLLGDIFPLSPIVFEESSLDQLWKDLPEKPASDVLQPQIKSAQFQTSRSRNGLKSLSWRVKEIVEILGAANYKGVADELLINLSLIHI